ncbi:MAG TPA: EAL domain-containing protein, partial [Alphaproteobacteria bacterium]|nr:EAL domain-containing protein [Alphaproteobacteria bacterium]
MSRRGNEASAARPEPSARRGRAAVRPPADPLRRFTWGIAFPTLLVYAIVCVLVLMTLRIMTEEINRVDADRGRSAVRAAIDTVLQQLGEQAADEATWTEAYVNTYAAFDAAWLDSTWGTAARGRAHYDTALVTDANGRILFGESVRGPLHGSAADHYGGAASLLKLLGAEVTRSSDGAIVAHLAPLGDSLAAVAVAVIHGSAGQLSVPPADRRILWLARTVDAGLLAELARRFDIPVPRLVRDGKLAPGEMALPLADAAGAPIGQVAWLPLRPGDAAFFNAASIATLVLVAVGILTYIALTSFRRSVERRAEVERRDWVGARYDASTGLLNRFGLEEAITRLIPRKRDALDVAIAYIEFEGLKDVAGSYGQQTTEALLNRLADLIDGGIQGEAQIARLGPDEFAICRTGEDAGERVRRFARVVLELVAEAIPLDDLRLKLAASIGIAECKVTRETVSEPITMATAALQHARETGGNHIVIHDSSLEESRQKRLALQADIRRGLDAGEFDLEYQPIFDFSRQRMLGVEALLRWPRRRGGILSPGEFIPAAEASGLIEELGLFSLRKACEDLVDLPGLKLSANVSTVQFRSPTLASR